MLKKKAPIWNYNTDDYDTVNRLYTDTRYNDKIRYTDNLTSTETLSKEMTVNQKLCRNIIIQYFKQHMFLILTLTNIQNIHSMKK